MTTVDPNVYKKPGGLPIPTVGGGFGGGISGQGGGNVTGTDGKTLRPATLYGRKWSVLIYKRAYKKDKDGKTVRDEEHDISIDCSLLRCVWHTEHKINTYVTLCSLIVYNLNAVTEGSILEDGFQISIQGGYQQGQYGEIFTGDIIQTFRNRENGVDYRLEIVAVKGIWDLDCNYVRATVAAGSTPRTQIQAVAQQADKPIQVGSVSKNLNQTPLPRGKVFFGTPAKYLRAIGVENDAHFWIYDDKVTVQKVADEIPEDQCLVLTPATGLIGTPVYSNDGIHISMLLDARVKLGTLIKIDNSIIQRQQIQLDQAQAMSDPKKAAGMNQVPQPWMFDQSGEYQVFSVSHSGDTWGNTWKTDVVGVSRQGRLGLLTPMKDSGTITR